MSFIQRELDRIGEALRAAPEGNQYAQLYAAQQALAWATEPNGYAAPSMLLMGIPAGSRDCSAHLHPTPSSDTCSRIG